jgi:aspartyl protease family protein
MRSIIVFAVLALGASIAVPRMAMQMGDPGRPKTAMTTNPAPASASNSRSFVVQPDARGHFQVVARVDGRRMGFMVDTGASVIALTANAAAQLGIHPARRDYVAEVRTANGTVRAAPIQLGIVEIGNLAVRDVTALVMPEEALSENLLGLSFLSRLRRFEYSNGRLVLEQ